VPPLLKGIPYPSSPEAVDEPLSRITDAEAQSWVRNYGNERWNRAKIKERLGKALDWSHKHNVPVYCGEFGVLPTNALPESRKKWYADFASVLKESKTGWAVWGWDDGFGFNRKHDGNKLILDPVPVKALGLNPL
jgi:hypothetical protein